MHTSSWWWDAEEGQVHARLLEYLASVEGSQSDTYDRFLKLACLYDPYELMGMRGGVNWSGPDNLVSENVVKSNVDTVAAIIARGKPRARFMTDGGDWTQQRTARRLELYAEGLVKILDVHAKRRRAFKDAAIFGTGLLKVYQDGKRIHVERVLVDEIVVDERECRSGPPRHMAQRRFVDRDVLKAKFPEHADAIDRAHRGGSSWGTWADYRQLEHNQVVLVESWRLPVGEPGDDDYIPGRRVMCVDGADLLDEEWNKPHFPFAEVRWNERTTGWYGVGLAEDIAGHQRALNKLNWQIDRQLDQHAVPLMLVQMADANIAVKTVTRAGTILPYKTAPPQQVMPPAVSPETYRRHETVKASAYEFAGVASLTATAKKPSGLDSGAALREYKDSTTERLAIQEQADERFFLDAVWLIIEAAKELGDNAPEVVHKTTYGKKWIRWADVDLGEVRVQIEAASSISRTPAGRTQAVIDWAQAGIISQDEARRLMQHPDLERAMSLYTAALEDIERCIEEILDGATLVPEPYQNLKLGVWRMQQSYLEAKGDGAPEEVLEGLRQWIVQAAHVVSMQQPAGAPPMNTGAPAPEAAPQAAFSQQAMQVTPA